jgi:hypothetical protein
MSKKSSTHSTVKKVSTLESENTEEKNLEKQSVEGQQVRPGSFADLISK